MSYYRKSYYSKPYYNKSYYRRPIYNPAPRKENYFDIYEYLKNEFFNADDETFQQIAELYKSNYGSSAYSYLLKTHKSWRNGSVGLSSLIMSRIIECVPKFLNPEKRLFILRCEIHNFIEKAKKKIKDNDLRLTNIHSVYETLQNEVLNFNQINLQWFIGKNIFPLDQIDYYLNICKYALNERLVQSYKQVFNDLSIITRKFNSFIREIDSAKYKVDFLNLSLDISQIQKVDIPYMPPKSIALNFNNSLSKFGEKYILEELMKMSFYEKEGEVNAMLKSKDIDTVFSHFIDLTKEKNEVIMTSTFKGEGGLLTLKLEFIPFRKSLETTIISSMKIIGIIVGLVLVTSIIFIFTLYPQLAVKKLSKHIVII